MSNRYYGFDKKAWNKAIDEIEIILVGVAKRKGQIFYSDLAFSIHSVMFQEPYHDLAAAIGSISWAHHHNNRPLLSVLVVRKEDYMPGLGFFSLAKEAGFKFKDNITFMADESNKCYNYWDKHNL